VADSDLERFYKARARDKVILAWGWVEKMAEIGAPDEVADLADKHLREACSVAVEWGLDPQAIVTEAFPSPTSRGTL
jgi:hypothetical protein